MNGEERARKRIAVETAHDFEKICVGDTLNVKIEFKISVSKDAIFSEEVFKSFIDGCAREFLREVCYERDS